MLGGLPSDRLRSLILLLPSQLTREQLLWLIHCQLLLLPKFPGPNVARHVYPRAHLLRSLQFLYSRHEFDALAGSLPFNSINDVRLDEWEFTDERLLRMDDTK